MQIAIFSRSTVRHFTSGGMESQLDTLVKGFADKGHEVTVITTSYPIEDSFISKNLVETEDKQIKESGVSYYYIGGTTPGLNPLSFWEKPFALLKLLKRDKPEGSKNYFKESNNIFQKLHREKPFDVAVSQSTVAKGVKFSKNLPVISIIHGTISAEIKNRYKANKSFMNWGRFLGVDLPEWLFEWTFSNRSFFKRINIIVSVSKDLQSKFIQEYPTAQDKVRVIYNGVDAERFHPGAEKFQEFTLLNIGRMDREKGVDLIIKSVNLLKEEGVRVSAKLIGSGVHLNEFEKLVKGLALESQIEFLGQIPNGNLIDFYQKSHVFVLPTRREEGHPVTLSESFCSGLPFIAVPKGGLKELITDEKTGFYVKEDDFVDLAAKIRILYHDRNRLAEMAAEAREEGLKKFSKSAMINSYEILLEGLVQKNA